MAKRRLTILSTTMPGIYGVYATSSGAVVSTGLFSRLKQSRIVAVALLSESATRSGGKMAVGALAGGVLLGGVGALAGAALRSNAKPGAVFSIAVDTGDVIVVRAETTEQIEGMLVLASLVEARSAKSRIAAEQAATVEAIPAPAPVPRLEAPPATEAGEDDDEFWRDRPSVKTAAPRSTRELLTKVALWWVGAGIVVMAIASVLS